MKVLKIHFREQQNNAIPCAKPSAAVLRDLSAESAKLREGDG